MRLQALQHDWHLLKEETVLQANRAHTYLGLREKEFHVSGDLKDIYPDFVMMANAFGVKAKRVSKPEELRPAIQVLSSSVCMHADAS